MSNFVIGPAPDRPARSPSHVAAVPIPRDVTSPMPVTTTRLLTLPPAAYFLLLAFFSMYSDGVLDARDLLGVLVGNLDLELFFERHDEFDGVE